MPTFENGWTCNECWTPNRAQDEKCYRCQESRSSEPAFDGTATSANAHPQATLDADRTTPPSTEPEPGRGLTCSNGHEIYVGQTFCSVCGERIAQGSPREVAAPPEPAVVAAAHPGTASPRGIRLPLAVVGALLLVAAVGAGLFFFVGQSKPAIRGVAMLWELDGGGITGDWDSCEGDGGYDDFAPGMSLSLRDGEGNIIGAGDVSNVSADLLPDIVALDRLMQDGGYSFIGLDEQDDDAAADELRETLRSGEGYSCMLYFEGQVSDAEFYTVELSDRGELSYSAEEMRERNFIVSLTLGDAP